MSLPTLVYRISYDCHFSFFYFVVLISNFVSYDITLREKISLCCKLRCACADITWELAAIPERNTCLGEFSLYYGLRLILIESLLYWLNVCR